MIKILKSGERLFSFFAVLFFVLLNTGLLSAQESILQSYERIFARAGLAAKAGVLRDAAGDEKAAEFAGALYAFALHYCLDNGELLNDDPDMITLVTAAARGAGVWGDASSAAVLWELFTIFRDSLPRVEILNALGVLGRDNISIIESLNQYLTGQNNYFRSGMIPDYRVLEACIDALGSLGDASSFTVLFSAMTAGYSRNITEKAVAALERLNGDYRQYLIGVIQKNPPAEKLAAFNLGAGTEKLSDADKGGLAEIALEAGLAFPGGGDDAAASLRYAAVNMLAKFKWGRANNLVVRHFYQVLSDYSTGVAPRERLIEAIACMGAMGNSEAAGVLSLQLGYFNSQTERSGGYDVDILLALIEALGAIGDKIAFDHLLYVGYLPYPERIQTAAREALNRLKW
jgi:HEAT repeat protein